MPEGDNVHRNAIQFRERFVGHRLRALYRGGVAEPRFSSLVLTSAEAIGKHLLLAFSPANDESPTMHARVHLGIAGRWRMGEVSPLQRKASPLLLDFATDAAAVMRPKEVVLERAGLVDRRPVAALGPDLIDDPDVDEILRRAREPRHAARALAELLLDQHVAAGIGNVYKSELCFLAKLHPLLRVDQVTDDQLRAIFLDGARLLSRNVGPHRRNTTGRPATGDRYFVYERAGRPCPTCGTAIERRATGPDRRSTFFCPRCQSP